MIKIVTFSDTHWRGLARHQEYTRAFKIFFSELKEYKPDLIVNVGDFYHSKTSSLTPELFDRLTWCFTELSNIATTINILGNHDVNLSNNDRLDIITPIINSLNKPNLFLYKKSGSYKHLINNKNICFHVFSLIDKENWFDIKPDETADMNIALFHGAVKGCLTDLNWTFPHGEVDVDFFKKYDFTFLGDIHKQQFLSYRETEETITEEQLLLYEKLYGKEHIKILEEINE